MRFAAIVFSMLIAALSATATQLPKDNFVTNAGQLRDGENVLNDVKYYYQDGSRFIYLRDKGLSYVFTNMEVEGESVSRRIDLDFRKCNSDIEITPNEIIDYSTNYYFGIESEGITGVKHFKRVDYKNVYNGIDLTVYFDNGNVRYDFIVHPGADPKSISLKVDGIDDFELDEYGNIRIEFPGGEVVKEKPFTYQIVEDEKKEISSKFTKENNLISFDFEDYNKNEKLIIDPLSLLWSSYYGGESLDLINDAVLSRDGYVYVCGRTQSSNGIATPYAYYTDNKFPDGCFEPSFIAKITDRGYPVWATYYNALLYSIEIDSLMNPVLVGRASCDEATSPGAHRTESGLENGEPFVVKFDSTGKRLWASFFGFIKPIEHSHLSNFATSIAINSKQEIFIGGMDQAGRQHSETMTCFKPDGEVYYHKVNVSEKGGCTNDVIIDQQDDNPVFTYWGTKLNKEHETIFFSGLVKFDISAKTVWNEEYDNLEIHSLTSDIDGNFYILAKTYDINGFKGHTPDFEVDKKYGNYLLAKLSPDREVVWLKYFPSLMNRHRHTNRHNENGMLYIDYKGFLYFYGESRSELPFSDYSYKQFDDGSEGFFMKMTLDGKMVYTSLFGGEYFDIINGFSVEPPNIIYIAGTTSSTEGVVTQNAYKKVYSGGEYDAFIAKFAFDTLDLIIYDETVDYPIDTLDLGKVCPDELTDSVFALRNFSDRGLKIIPKKLGDLFNVEFVAGDSLPIADTLYMKASFENHDRGEYGEMVYFHCTEVDYPVDSLFIMAEVVSTELYFSGDNRFGRLRPGDRDTINVFLENNGNQNAYVEEVPEVNPPFSVINAADFPVSIPPSGKFEVLIEVWPQDYGRYDDVARAYSIQTDSSCADDAMLNLTCIVSDTVWEISAESLLFGPVPTCISELDTLVVTNLGKYPIRIMNYAILDDAGNHFEIISAPPKGAELNFLEESEFIIRFNPNDMAGDFTARLEIETNNKKAEFIYAGLRGISENIELKTVDIDFGNCVINRAYKQSFDITNENDFDVNITEFRSESGFVTVSPEAYLLKSGKTYTFEAEITLQETGAHSEELTAIIGEPCNDAYVINVKANGISGDAEVTEAIDLGQKPWCEEEVREIEVKSTGTYRVILKSVSLVNEANFELLDNPQNVTLQPGETEIIRVKLLASAAENQSLSGVVTTVIEINGEDVEYTTEIKVERYISELNKAEELEMTSVGVEQETLAKTEIENTGQFEFMISDARIEPVNSYFSISDIKLNSAIAPNEISEIEISYLPEEIGTHNAELILTIQSGECELEEPIDLIGHCIQELTIFLPDTTAPIGSKLGIPLRAYVSKGGSTDEAINYTADVRFISDIYYPDENAAGIFVNPANNGSRTVRFEGIIPPLGETETVIGEMTGIVMLSRVSRTPLEIVDFTLDKSIPTVLIDGSLTRDSTCIDDLRGIQMFLPTSIAIKPEPAIEEITLEITTEESGTFEIAMYSIEGRQLYTSTITDYLESTRTMEQHLDISNLPNGLYRLTLRSPGYFLNKVVRVVR